MLKFMLPMLRLHISGFASSGAASRSSSVMFSPPPVVMFTTASTLCLITGRKRMNTAGSGVGSPVFGSRACRWMIAAPASAASIEERAISSGVIGRWSDMLGVWIAPVTAQLMITLPAMVVPPGSFWSANLHRASAADQGSGAQHHLRGGAGGQVRSPPGLARAAGDG